MNINDIRMLKNADYVGTVNKLESELKTLKNNIDCVLNNIKLYKNKENEFVDLGKYSLGLIQGQGCSIDNLCGKICELKDVITLLNNIK